MSANALSIAATAAKIQTIADIRAAMGAVTLTLSQAYARLDDISWIAGEKKAATDLIDTVNKSAQLLYAKYNDDPDLQDEDISAWNAHLAGQVIAQANDALTTVENAANENLWDISSIVDDALVTVGHKVGTTIQGVTNAIAGGASAFLSAAWPTVLLVAGGVILYVYRKPILNAIAKAAS